MNWGKKGSKRGEKGWERREGGGEERRGGGRGEKGGGEGKGRRDKVSMGGKVKGEKGCRR